MNPNFALSLTLDGISLLHRVSGGWQAVGEVALDADNLDAELAMLRKSALGLDPKGMRTKLVLPNDQIKFMALDDPAAGGDQIRAALDGTTPYALSELVYDQSGGAGRTFVAAVAKETLTEAEAFAVKHRFNPVCFVAVPEPGSFEGEPFFGLTEAAASGSDQDITRDTAPVKVIGRATLPKPSEPKPSDEAEDETEAPAPDEPAPVFSSRAKPLRAESDHPAAPPHTLSAPPRLPTEPGGQPMFASRSRPADAQRLDPPKLATPTGTPSPEGAELAGLKRDNAGVTAAIPTDLRAVIPDPVASPPVTGDGANDSPSDGDAANIPPVIPTREAGLIHIDDDLDDMDASITGANGGPGVTARDLQRGFVKPEAPGKNNQDKATAFGAPKKRARGIGGKPRYLALLLTVILLLFLAAIASYAAGGSGFLARLFGLETHSDAVATLPAAETEDAFSQADDELASDLAELEELDPPAAPGLVIAELAPVAVTGQIMTESEALRRYAATGVWQRAARPPLAPRTESLIDVFIATIDPVTFGSDAVALPAAATLLPDAMFPAPNNPPKYGAQYDRDAAGFILATPEGTKLPEGITIYAGRPATVPPERLTTTPSTDPAPTFLAPGAEAFAGIRPSARPDSLSDAAEAAVATEQANSALAGLRPSLRPAGLAPQIAEPESDPAIPSVDAEAIVAAIAAAAPANPTAGATALAIGASPRPDLRPRNFSRVVASAQTAAPAAASQPAAAPQTEQIASPTGPVPGGVARAATEDNVIRLRDINLIGISGSSNNRVAIVRMPNGRILRLGVGDQLDGGRVTAIGETALNYVKRGRTYALEIPRG